MSEIEKYPKDELREKIKGWKFATIPTKNVLELLTAEEEKREKWRVDAAKKLKELLKENGDSLSMKYTREQIIRMLLEALET